MSHSSRAHPRPGRLVAGLAVLLALTLALSGCTGGTGADDARLDYEGSGHGTDRDTAVCDGDAHLTITAGVTDGLVVFRVLDGDGTEIFLRTVNAAFETENQALQGAEGPWGIEATRSESFSGFYGMSLDCEPDFAENGNTTDDGDFVRAPRHQ